MRKFLLRNVIFLLAMLPLLAGAQRKKGLTIGDKLPDIEFAKLINYSKNSAKISDFKGKALLLDFWAPWCTPCITGFPKLNSLQNKFNDKLQIIPITAENQEYSTQSLKHLKNAAQADKLMSVVEDTIASKLFEHKLLPHYVWVDGNGIVKAITGMEEVTEDNIQRLIDGEKLGLRFKQDRLIYPGKKPLFSDSRVEFADQLVFHSALTKYIQGIGQASQKGKNWINCTNHTISLLYKIAFGQFNYSFFGNSNPRFILEGFTTQSDSLMIGRYTNQSKKIWKENWRELVYNYELIVPDTNISPNDLFKYMQDDLNRIFALKGLRGHLEKRDVKVLVLSRTTAEDKLKSAGGQPKDLQSDYFIEIRNRPLYVLIDKLQAFYTESEGLTIINETSYDKKVDLQINADLRDITAVNKELEKYGLQLAEKIRGMEVIIITKTSP